jgi:hypothetical protein
MCSARAVLALLTVGMIICGVHLKIHGTKITRNCQHGRKNRRKKYEDTTTVYGGYL